MQLLKEAILFIVAHPGLIYQLVFVLALLGGEELIVFFAILSGYGLINIWILGLCGFLGILIADMLWFAFARTKFFEWIKGKLKGYRYYKHANKLIEKLSHRNTFIYLFITKFIYGFRIVSVMKVSRRRKSFLKFLLCDASAIILWAAIMLPIGFFLGKLFSPAINVFENVKDLLAIAIAFIVILYLIERELKVRLER